MTANMSPIPAASTRSRIAAATCTTTSDLHPLADCPARRS